MGTPSARLTNSMYAWQKKPEQTLSPAEAQDPCLLTSFLPVCRNLPWYYNEPLLTESRLVKHIPTWMPGAGFKRHALRTRVKVRTMHDAPYEMVQKTVVRGKTGLSPK